MKKQLLSCLLLLASICLGACNQNDSQGEGNTDDNTPPIQYYTITWKNWNGTTLEVDRNVRYGSYPSYDSTTPTRASDSQYTYTFNCWSPSLRTVKSDMTYTATFNQQQSQQYYTITWKNWNGTTLETDYNVPEGTYPSYDGTTPVKSDDDQYTYTFSGWTPSLATVTNNATYTATFTQQEKSSDYSIFEVSDGWAIEKYNGSESRITVPSSIKGHQIVEIAEKAFLGNTKLLSVALPNTIKRIGESAFDSCSRLYSINLPSSCVSVGKRCFAFTALTSITIPANLTSIGLNWLANCKLTKVTFLGSLNEAKFVGDYLNNIVNWNANFDNGDNVVEEHFKATHEQTDWVFISNGAYGNYFPTKEIYDWELLDTNRFLNAEVTVKDLVNDKNMYVQMKLFVNGPESNFTISKSTEYSSYTASWGKTVSVETKTIRYISGKMHMSLDVLSEIVIPSSSTVSNETLLGMLENVTVTRQ